LNSLSFLLAVAPPALLNGAMAIKFRKGRWSMKHDRELIDISKKTHSLRAIVEKLDRPMSTVLKRAARLGLSIKRVAKAKRE
jgi:hypothetical protein